MKRGDDTREAILQAGLDMARAGGLAFVTARGVAAAVGRAHTGIRYYFPGEGALREAVARAAIERDDVRIIARLILDGHHSVAKLDPGVRQSIMIRAERASVLPGSASTVS